jgi:hypothetical protein
MADIVRHWPGFNPRPVHVGFTVDEVTLGQAFLRVLKFPPFNVIPPVLHTHFFYLSQMLYNISNCNFLKIKHLKTAQQWNTQDLLHKLWMKWSAGGISTIRIELGYSWALFLIWCSKSVKLSIICIGCHGWKSITQVHLYYLEYKLHLAGIQALCEQPTCWHYHNTLNTNKNFW